MSDITITMATDKEQIADFRIAYDGTWYHQGDPILREALARLFATRALVCDADGRYWLQTPFEQYPVEVEDVPFVIVHYNHNADTIDCITNMEERVPLGPGHPLEWCVCRKTGQRLPYIRVRSNLYARLGRAVYYDMVEQFGTALPSRGASYPLGDPDA